MNRTLTVPNDEITLTAIRAQGAGGQNVNKVASAIHLRFDIHASSLPEYYKQRLLSLNDKRINKDGILVIKAQRFRTQDKNRDDALNRLQGILKDISRIKKTRRATRPSKASQRKRLDSKTRHGRTKALRGRVTPE